MKTTGRWLILGLVFGGLVIAAMASCGGRAEEVSPSTGGSPTIPGTPSTGGSPTIPGTPSTGGSPTIPGTIVAAPRTPSDHRAEALSCVDVFSPAEPIDVVATVSTCTQHADCTEGEAGKCTTSGVGMAGDFYSCSYDLCATDGDCDPGKVCYCTAATAAKCMSIGNCQTDADCGGGAYSYCSPSISWDCGGYRPIDGYHCHTAADSCMDSTDCTGTDYCNFDVYAARWVCMAINDTCMIG